MTFSFDATGIHAGDDYILKPVSNFQLYRGLTTEVVDYAENGDSVSVVVRWTCPVTPSVIEWKDCMPKRTEWKCPLVRGWLRRVKPEREPDGVLYGGYVSFALTRSGENMSETCGVAAALTRSGRSLVTNFKRTSLMRYRSAVQVKWLGDIVSDVLARSSEYYTDQSQLEILCAEAVERMLSDVPSAWMFQNKVKLPGWLGGEVERQAQFAGESFDPLDSDAFAIGRDMPTALGFDLRTMGGNWSRVVQNYSVYPAHYSCEFKGALWDVLCKDNFTAPEAYGEENIALARRFEKLTSGLHMFRLLYGAEDVARNILIKCLSEGRRDTASPCIEEEYDLEYVARDVYDVDADDADICFDKLSVTQSTLMGIAEEVVDLIEDTFALVARDIEEDYDYQTSTSGVLEMWSDSIFESDNIVESIIRELK